MSEKIENLNKQKTQIITPRKVQGFWELMPEEQALFSRLLNALEEVFCQNSFVPLDTPVLEFSDALLAKSGGETDKQVFRLTKGDNDLCMRYDLTVPLARFVAMHKNELAFPFKRYQIGKVYRGERPQKGRFREFYQCDADIIGDGQLSLVADGECVRLFEKCFEKLGLNVTIHLSNRKILSGFLQEIEMEEKSHEILTILDKADKLPVEELENQLQNLGISKQNCQKLQKLSKICGKIQENMPILRDFCKNQLFQEGLNELEEVSKYLSALSGKNYVLDISIIRGHDYYTGTVFEGLLENSRQAVVGGGGRYENLCGYFSTQKMPGVGMSVGITRLFDLLMENDEFLSKKTPKNTVAIINFDETQLEALEILENLRQNKISADCLYGSNSFKSKMKEANRKNFAYVIIVGETEVQNKKYVLKNMETGEQQNLPLEEIVSLLKSKNF